MSPIWAVLVHSQPCLKCIKRGLPCPLFLKLFPICVLNIIYSLCCHCSVAKSCPTLCDPRDCSMPGFSVLHYLLEFAQTHVRSVCDATQPSHSLSPPSPPALNLSQQWVSSSHQVAKVLELQLHHQSFQWIFRVDFLWDWLVWSPCSPRDSQESSPAP